METRYQIVGKPGIDQQYLFTMDELEGMLRTQTTRTNRSLRTELQNEPQISGMIGPMWGGWRDADGEYVFLEDDRNPASTPKPYSKSKGPITTKVIRYETPEAYDVLSR